MDIDVIRQAIFDNCLIQYTTHCQKRMLERNISRADIRNCILSGEIIEEYPLANDNTSEKSFPSCLILGKKENDNKKIHIVVGYNGKILLIISACYPDMQHWLEDCKTRR